MPKTKHKPHIGSEKTPRTGKKPWRSTHCPQCKYKFELALVLSRLNIHCPNCKHVWRVNTGGKPV